MARHSDRTRTINREKERAAKFATRTSRMMMEADAVAPRQHQWEPEPPRRIEPPAQPDQPSAPAPLLVPEITGLRLPGSTLPVMTVALIIISVGLFFRSLNQGFAWMDYQYLLNNPLFESYRNLGRLLASASFGEGGVAVYRPVTLLSYMGSYQTWATYAAGYHASNLTLHMLSSILVYVLAYQLFGRNLPSVLAALLFAVHPIHAETVTWIAGRPDLLVTFWGLLAAIAFLICRDEAASPFQHRVARLGLLIFTTAAVFAKESAALLPAIFLLWDYLHRRSMRQQWREWAVFYAPLAAVVAVLLVARAVILTPGDGIPASWPLRLASLPGLLLQYLGYLAWPFSAIPFHLVRAAGAIPWYLVTLYAVVVAGLFAAIWSLRHTRPVLTWCLLFGPFVLAPMVLFVPAWPSLLSERFLYLPSVGVCLAFGYLAGAVIRSFPRRRYRYPSWAVVVVVVLVFTAGSAYRATTWADEVRVWQQVVARNDNNDAAYYQLGNAYYNHGRFMDAAMSYVYAVRLDRQPRYLYNMGNAWALAHRPQDAVQAYLEALRLRPNYPECYHNLANAYVQLGRLDLARAAYKSAADLAPGSSLAQLSRAAMKQIDDLVAKQRDRQTAR